MISRLKAALDRLYQRRTFGIKLGLDAVRRLCVLCGNPQASFAVIHVAGTNGKGSVSAMIASVLQQTGLHTGLYTSPHMVRFNERIRIDGQDVSDAALVEALAVCEKAADQVAREQQHEVTFFEITTVMAFLCFQRAGVKLAVLETGLGGRLDATNVVHPLISVITRVALDHEAYLGNTLEAVAAEKAGIIKSGRPVVCGPQAPEVSVVLETVARDVGSPYLDAQALTSVQRCSGDLAGQKIRYETTGGFTGTVELPLTGDYQLENAGVALAVIDTVMGMLGIERTAALIRDGFARVRWRGRLELLRTNPIVLTDAAHNPSAAAMLVKTLKVHGMNRIGLVIGMCSDKDVSGVVRHLAGIAQRVWAVPISNDRAVAPRKLAALFANAGIEAKAMECIPDALHAAEDWALDADAAVLVAGSIFLLADVLPCYD